MELPGAKPPADGVVVLVGMLRPQPGLLEHDRLVAQTARDFQLRRGLEPRENPHLVGIGPSVVLTVARILLLVVRFRRGDDIMVVLRWDRAHPTQELGCTSPSRQVESGGATEAAVRGA